MDLSLATTSRYTENRDWLADGEGIHTFSGTLDISAFTEGTHYPDGYIPSGVGLRDLGGGMYGPASGAVNEVQSITVDGTGGTWTITIAGETTTDLDFDATATEVQDALEALVNIEDGDVTVTGGPGDAGGTNPYVLTFGGNLGGDNVPAVTTADSLTGGAGTAVVGTTTGGSSTGDPAGYLFNSQAIATDADLVVPIMDEGHVLVERLPSGSGYSTEFRDALPGIRHYEGRTV